MKHLINLLLLTISVLDFSIIDSDGDRSKAIVYIHYSNGTSDKLVVSKDELMNHPDRVVDIVTDIYEYKLKEPK